MGNWEVSKTESLHNKGNHMRNTVGLDISKNTIDATALIGGSTAYKQFQNHEKGHHELKDWIQQQNGESVHICMEATGTYYEDAAAFLSTHHTVYVVNPLKISKYAESKLSRTKTDKRDSRLIADYLQSLKDDELNPYHPPSAHNAKLKRLTAFYSQLQTEHTGHKNRLSAAKDETVKATTEAIIAFLGEKLKETKQAIEALTKHDKNAKRLQTIPSIGKLTAAVLLYFLTNYDFKNANKLTAFAGLSPQKKQSGTSVNGKDKLTKYGNRKLRAALFMPAMVAYRDNVFPDFIRRLTKKGKPKKVIIAAIMRKLLVIAYHLHKTQTDYDKNRYARIA